MAHFFVNFLQLIEGLNLFDFDVVMFFELVENIIVSLVCDERNGDTIGTETTRTAYTMHVSRMISVLEAEVGNDRHVVVDDEIDLGDIDATSQHIRANER